MNGRDATSDMVRSRTEPSSVILWSIGTRWITPTTRSRIRSSAASTARAIRRRKNLVTLDGPDCAVKGWTHPVGHRRHGQCADSDAGGAWRAAGTWRATITRNSITVADHQKYPKRILFAARTGIPIRTGRWCATALRLRPVPWTGIDYLGEANSWPNRANGAGCSICAASKETLAWFRQSLWSDQPMVYLCVAGGDERPARTSAAARKAGTGVEPHRYLGASPPARGPARLNGTIVGSQRRADARTAC